MRVRLDGELHDVAEGSFVFIPRGTPHAWQNIGADLARFLFCFTPAAPGVERFFERGASSGAPVEERCAMFAGDAGFEIVGPPL